MLTANIHKVPVSAANSSDADVVLRLKKDEAVVAMEEASGALIAVQTPAGSGWVDPRLLRIAE